jgi:hypothetical protein
VVQVVQVVLVVVVLVVMVHRMMEPQLQQHRALFLPEVVEEVVMVEQIVVVMVVREL